MGTDMKRENEIFRRDANERTSFGVVLFCFAHLRLSSLFHRFARINSDGVGHKGITSIQL